MSAISMNSSPLCSDARLVVATMMLPLKATQLMDQVRERIRYLHYISLTQDR
jgi:hypothetical protein